MTNEDRSKSDRRCRWSIIAIASSHDPEHARGIVRRELFSSLVYF